MAGIHPAACLWEMPTCGIAGRRNIGIIIVVAYILLWRLSLKYVSDIIIYSNQAPPITPSAAFISNKQSGTVLLTVQFTDQSTGTSPLKYTWDFNNDGIVDSTIQSPSHTYTSAGTYTVNLTVSNSCGSDSEVSSPILLR